MLAAQMAATQNATITFARRLSRTPNREMQALEEVTFDCGSF
jgi:hypothetical protein